MSTWAATELDTIGTVTELDITTRRSDGTLRPYVPIWVVRVGDELYVRSYKGRNGAWFRHAVARGAAHIHTARVDRDVTAVVPDASTRAAIDDAYRSKYARYGAAYVLPMIADAAAGATLRLTPTD